MSGLPQLEIATYLPQAVWTAGSLLVLLSGMTAIGGRIARNIEARKKVLEARTASAKASIAESNAAVAALESEFEKTKRQVADTFSNERARLTKAADAELDAATRKTAENLAKFKQELAEEEANLDLTSEVAGVSEVLDKTLFKKVDLGEVKWK